MKDATDNHTDKQSSDAQASPRRDFLKAAGVAAFTTSLFTGNVKGANDRVNLGFIGMGKMGRSNLDIAMKQENVAVSAVCDVFDRNLGWAAETARKRGAANVKAIKDFREILADKSIDAVCIATPDHWHPYMTVEACKAGKDVYVEKPICVTIDEGKKMVQAARKYKRVVQAGTMQRSAKRFREAVEIVRSGEIGQVTFVRTWNYANAPVEGIGNPPDSAPPPGLDWNTWLGPAPLRPFNENRFGVDPQDRYYSRFRYFWDYAGGMMTDWGIHLLDIVQMAFDETMPLSVCSMGGKFRVKDDRETPDELQVTYQYPNFVAVYENRESNAQSMFKKGYGILFHGDKGTLFVDRSGYHLFPEEKSGLKEKASGDVYEGGNDAHWANFLTCMKTREKPTSDIEKCFRSTTTCLLGNISLWSKLRLEWDDKEQTIVQAEARKYMQREERAPWKIVV